MVQKLSFVFSDKLLDYFNVMIMKARAIWRAGSAAKWRISMEGDKIYERLIISTRHRKSTAERRPIETEFESDRGRLIFSGPFRRLQRKTQVFPLEICMDVRSRLTHSFEVAHIGRYIAQCIIRQFRKEDKLEDLGLCEGREIAFVTLVETACLMHDIGNPPFGHFGEYGIRDWFEHNGKKHLEKAIGHNNDEEINEFYDTFCQDFRWFDGNAQGLRIVTKLQGNAGKAGLNLTYSQLATYLKYVVLPDQVNTGILFSNKPGFFYSESDIVEAIWENLGIPKNCRHPLAFIMEAADDIAFCMSDIEDGIEKRIITEEFLITQLKAEWDKTKRDKIYKNYLTDLISHCWNTSDNQIIAPFVNFKTTLINEIVSNVASIYINNHDSIINGNADSLISKGTKEYDVLQTLRVIASNNIYCSRDAEDLELGGYAVITGLLLHFSRLLKCSRKDFNEIKEYSPGKPITGNLDLERRLFNLLPQKYIGCYKESVNKSTTDIMEWFYRAHLIVDYLSGMMDNYALETYQILSGIKVG